MVDFLFEEYEDILVMSDDKKLELAEELKDHGKTAFQNKDVEVSFHYFTKAIKFLILIDPKSASENIKLSKASLLSILQNNTASCHMKKGNWESIIDLCDASLQYDPQNVKALYRRGSALLEIQEYEKSASDLYDALALEPVNVAVKNKLEVLNARLKKYNHKTAIAMQKLFNK